MAFSPDPGHLGLGAAAGLFCLGFLVQRSKTSRAQARAAALEEERRKPQAFEYRLERYDVLWYPVVTADVEKKTVTQVKAGSPHCRACFKPLSLAAAEWTCAQCGAKHPESVIDLSIIDGIAKQALQYFKERHPDFRVVP